MFFNVKACLTEVPVESREVIKRIIEDDGGGKIMKELTSGCDVLITLVFVHCLHFNHLIMVNFCRQSPPE